MCITLIRQSKGMVQKRHNEKKRKKTTLTNNCRVDFIGHPWRESTTYNFQSEKNERSKGQKGIQMNHQF